MEQRLADATQYKSVGAGLGLPEPNIPIQSISIDPQGLYMAAINNKVKQSKSVWFL